MLQECGAQFREASWRRWFPWVCHLPTTWAMSPGLGPRMTCVRRGICLVDGSRASINQAVAAVRDDAGVRMEEAGLPHLEPRHSTDHLDARGGALALEETEVPDRTGWR